ncbi:MAG: hypothetical protein IKA36_02820 [Clostridia bacterium]|nr:hypothetical protein [Clostridia bacterium]
MNDIDQIEELTLEAEMNVLITLCDCYEKQAMILEYSTSEDVSEFSVFQEGLLERDEGESKLKTVLLLPLRLIGSFVKLLNNFIKMCRDKIRQIRSKKKINKLDPNGDFDKLKPIMKNGVLYITSDINLDAVEYEISNFDIDNPDKNNLHSTNIGKPTEYKMEDYLLTIDKICDMIEKFIVPKLNEKMEEYQVELNNVKRDTSNDNTKANRDNIVKIQSHITKLKNALANWNKLVKKISSELKIAQDIVNQVTTGADFDSTSTDETGAYNKSKKMTKPISVDISRYCDRNNTKGVDKVRFITDIVEGKYTLKQVELMVREFEKRYGSDVFANYDVERKQKPWKMRYLGELTVKALSGMASKQLILHIAEVAEYIRSKHKKYYIGDVLNAYGMGK